MNLTETLKSTLRGVGRRLGMARAAGMPPGSGNGPAVGGSAAMGPSLNRIILSTARDRWQSTSVRNYTPDMIEGILRGAFNGDLLQRWQLFDVMQSTWPRLAKGLSELSQAVTDHEWPLQPYCDGGKKPSAEALRRRRIVQEVLWGMEADPTKDENGTEEFLGDMADAWAKGISVQELDWELRSTPLGQITALKCSRWIHPRCYGYPSNARAMDRLMLKVSELSQDNPQLQAQLDALAARGLVEREGQWCTFPPDKFLVAVAKQKSGHPIGGALLQPLAWWWCVSNFSASWMVEKAQLFGVPMRMAYYAEGTDQAQINKITEMLENMGTAAYGVFKAGTIIDIKEAVTNATGDPSIAVQLAADMACDLIVTGNTVTSAQGQRGRDLSTERMDVMSQRKRGLLNWTAGRINRQLIPMICRLNFGDTQEMPFVTTGDEAEKDAKATAETVEVWKRAGMEVPRSWAHERAGIPEPEPGEPVLGAGAGAGVAGDPKPGATPGVEDTNDPALHPADPPEEDSTTGPTASAMAMAARSPFLAQAAASSRDVALAEAVLRELPGITEAWAGQVKPYLLQLTLSAQNPNVTDANFNAMIARAQSHLPESMGSLLNREALASAMEKAMGAAMVQGIASVRRVRVRQGNG